MVDSKLEALEQCMLELVIAISVGEKKEEGKNYFSLGNTYSDQADYQQAIKNYTEALSIFKEIGFKAGAGITCCNLGNAFAKLGNFKQAMKYHEHWLDIAKEVGDRVGEGGAYGNIGNDYDGLGNFKQAIEYHKQHLSIAKEVLDRAGEGRAYGNLGNAYDRLSNFKQAIEYHEQHLSIANELGDRAGEGRAYGNLGNAYASLGNFKQAIEYHKKHLSIAKEVENRAEVGAVYGNLGNAYASWGNFKQAIEYYEHHLSVAEEVRDRAGEGRACGNLGSAYANMGNVKQAIEYHERNLSIAKEVGDRDGEGSAYGSLGNDHDRLGNFKQAIEYHKQHLSIAKEVGNRDSEGGAYCNLGNAYESLGNYKRAIKYRERHLSIAKEVGDRVGEGGAYGNLGKAYANLGMFKEAIDYHKHHLRIAKELGIRTGEGKAYANLGNACVCLGNFKNAIEYYEQYLSIAKEVEDRAGEGIAYANLGNAYTALGNFKKAIEYHEHHLGIAKEVGDRAGEGKAYGTLGNAYAGLGNFEQAIKYHRIYLGIAKEVGDTVGEATAYYSVGCDHELSGSLGDALSCYLISIEHFDKIRLSLQSEDAWKISFRHLTEKAYNSLWRAFLKNGEIEEALYAAEKGRAQALRDILNEQYGIDSHSFSEVASKETLLSALDFLSSQTVFVALDGNIISFWVLRKGSKILFRQKEISQGIPDLLVKTFLKEIGVRGGVRCEDRSLDNVRSDLPLSRKPSSGKTHRSSNSSINTLQPLYDVLIRPIVDLLQSDELIVVPDGPFCLAPYCALSESIRIRTAPSLTFLKMIAGASEDFHDKTGALLVGDPWLRDVTNEDGKPILEQLPCAKEEVEMIGELLETAPLTGRNATKSEVLKKMKSVALIHIAAHGGQATGEIALAPNPQRQSSIPKEEDFILKVSDVQAVRLRARLVVLSCCHSGRGDVKSEGVVGIARAFLCAGARSVLVSLWAIDDETTLLFMRNFYQHLGDGNSANAALHQAMKSLRESKQYCAVKHWAPFVLIGDDVTLDIKRKWYV